MRGVVYIYLLIEPSGRVELPRFAPLRCRYFVSFVRFSHSRNWHLACVGVTLAVAHRS